MAFFAGKTPIFSRKIKKNGVKMHLFAKKL